MVRLLSGVMAKLSRLFFYFSWPLGSLYFVTNFGLETTIGTQ